MSQYSQPPQPPYDQQPLHSNLPQQAGGYPGPQHDNESLGGWVLTIFLTFIPLVNLIYMLVLAFSANTSIAKRNFARATLIWMLVGIVLSIIGFIIMAIFGMSLVNEISNTYPMEFDY